MAMITNEKKRMFLVGLAVIFCAIILGAVIDAYVTMVVLKPRPTVGEDWNFQAWFPINTVFALIICSLGAFASWFGDSHKQGKEDKVGATLIFASPLILTWSGIGDILSACFQELFYHGNFLQGFNTWFWNQDWWWMNWGSLPYILSRLLKSSVTSFGFILLGSIIGVVLVVFVWYLYLKKV
jgi:hypothetical protein